MHLAMFAKFWEAGKVKTRLAATIGPEQARDVYLAFLDHLIRKLDALADLRTLVYSPPEHESSFRERFPDSWQLHPQADGDLGTRMRTFFETFGESAEQKNILIGSDAPDVPQEYIVQAAELLDEVPVVFGPSTDGGYYLIGMRGKPVNVFEDIPWSTEQVMQSTISLMESQQISYRLLPEWTDVDEVDDFRNLLNRLKSAEGSGAEQRLLDALLAMELPGVS